MRAIAPGSGSLICDVVIRWRRTVRAQDSMKRRIARVERHIADYMALFDAKNKKGKQLLAQQIR